MTTVNSSTLYQGRSGGGGGGFRQQRRVGYNIVRSITWMSCCLIVLCSVILLLIPDNNNNNDAATTTSNNNNNSSNSSNSSSSRIEMFSNQLQKIKSKLVVAKQQTRLLLLMDKNLLLQQKRKQFQQALDTLTDSGIPTRLRTLRQQNSIIGERLIEIKEGTITVPEIIVHQYHPNQQHQQQQQQYPIETDQDRLDESDINNQGQEEHIDDNADDDQFNLETLQMILNFFNTTWINAIQEKITILTDNDKLMSPEEIWEKYHDFILNTVYPFDMKYRYNRIPKRHSKQQQQGDHTNNNNSNDTIFISIVSYRDSIQCSRTLQELYSKALYPHRISIGLVQQNCNTNCRSGSIIHTKKNKNNISTIPVPPDLDCYKLFCDTTDIGKTICNNNNNNKNKVPSIRVITLDDTSTSFGPYIGRYIASKLWLGEHWYMQIDSRMTFQLNWDELVINMLNQAPSNFPIISHYPPEAETFNFTINFNQPTNRLCGPVFTTTNTYEEQIIRIEGMGIYDKHILSQPAYTPFVSTNFFIGHSNVLHSVPFDPFLPWINIGDDIYMSVRLWTAGYDLFAPTQAIVAQYYNDKYIISPNDYDTKSGTLLHRPKFWETERSFFYTTPSLSTTTITDVRIQSISLLHASIQALVLQRIKYLLGYPESARDMIYTKTILSAIEHYSVGRSNTGTTYSNQPHQQRTVHQYMIAAGINVSTKEVTYTEWCENGYPPPPPTTTTIS